VALITPASATHGRRRELLSAPMNIATPHHSALFSLGFSMGAWRLAVVIVLICSGCSDDRNSTEAAMPTAAATVTKTRPNVILITIDTLRADALGVYGQQRPTSPNLDRLAREGVVFMQAMTSAPSTLSSHASIMTGTHPYVHGARANAGFILSEDNQTFAEIMRQAGYRTGAEIAATVIHHGTQLDQGFDQYRDMTSGDIKPKSVMKLQPDGSRVAVDLNERQADDITIRGIEFIRQNQKRSFLLWLHYFDPHAHYSAPESFNALIPDSPYHAEVRYVDQEIGRLIRSLVQLGLEDRTLVVITSDHGESLMEHDEGTHSSYVYETTMRVPLIFWGTRGLRNGLSIETLVRTIDIGPTLLDLLDLPPFENTQGRSLKGLLSGEATDLQLMGYGESMELQSLFGSSILRAVRHQNWKYIHKLRPELYDLSQDPSELNNVAEDNPDIVEGLLERMRKEILDAPKKSKAGVVAIDDSTLRQLQALGYVGATPKSEWIDEIDALEPKGPDPSDLIGDVHHYAEAWQHSSFSDYLGAVEAFERLAARHPESPMILVSLADALIHLERHEEAVSVLLRTVDSSPGHAKAYRMLAESEEALGHFQEAEAAIRSAIALQSCESSGLLRLAQILGKSGRQREQAEALRAGVEECPVGYEVLNNYAYLLSTSHDVEVRNATEAVRVARLAVEKSQGARPEILDTLAGAHAADGEFESAIRISQRAVALARKRGMPSATIEALESNLGRFLDGQPVH